MKPLLTHDTFYYPVEQGVRIVNNRGASLLKGKSMARLLDILTPYFDGHYTLAEIINFLPQDKQGTVTKLVDMLHSKGYVKDLSTDLPHGLSELEMETYAAEMAFIGSFVDSAAFHFEQYRLSRVVLIGAGLALSALVHAVLQSGLLSVSVIMTDECPTDVERFTGYLSLFGERDGRQRIEILKTPDWRDTEKVSRLLEPYETVLAIADRPMLARLQLINTLCVKNHKNFLPALVIEDKAWIGPFVAGEAKGCWECAWRRLQSHVVVGEEQGLYTFADQSAEPTSPFIAMPTLSITANVVGFEFFKDASGVKQLDTQGHLIALDLRHLKSERFAFAPHPLCTICGHQEPLDYQEFQAEVQALIDGPTIEVESFSQQAAQLFDRQLGIFATIDEDDLTQIPLNVSRVKLSRPYGFPQEHEAPTAIGVGTEFGVARRRATQRASELYASQVYHPGQFLQAKRVRAIKQEYPLLKVYTRQLSLAEDIEDTEQYVWGYTVATDEVVLVPAGLVFQQVGDRQQSGGSDEVGSGMNWQEAVSRTVFAHTTKRVQAGLADYKEAFPVLNIAPELLTARGQRLLHLLELQKIESTVYVIAGSEEIGTYAFCLGDKAIAYVSHIDPQQALEDGLERVLQYHQARENEEAAYGPAPVVSLPATLRGTEQIGLQTLLPTTSLSWEDIFSQLVEMLRRENVTRVVVPLHGDETIKSVLPYIVRILGEDQQL